MLFTKTEVSMVDTSSVNLTGMSTIKNIVRLCMHALWIGVLALLNLYEKYTTDTADVEAIDVRCQLLDFPKGDNDI